MHVALGSRVLLVLALLGAVATPGSSSRCPGQREVTVMTRNLYWGFSEEPVLAAQSPLELLLAVTAAWQSVQDTDFRERAVALADEIDATRPDLIGLQEAMIYRVQSPGDLLSGGTTPATDVAFDFVGILLDELRARGLPYEVAVSADRTDLELPTLSGDDVRLTDRDVILARAERRPGFLQVLDTDAGEFSTLLQLPVGGAGGPVATISRGWVSADVLVRGRCFRVVNTHLESAYEPVQIAQAFELVAGPASTSRPVILFGDFNTDAYATHDGYALLLGAGFTDTWTDAHPLDPGLTWGHDPDLQNAVPAFTERDDLVLYRGRFGVEDVVLTGIDPAERTASGLWASDHAGVVATLSIPARE